ncbi:hypothetical protein RCL1_001209 [Eukaryota sp. TZLM3-RCL]
MQLTGVNIEDDSICSHPVVLTLTFSDVENPIDFTLVAKHVLDVASSRLSVNLLEERHHFSAGENTITVTLPGLPEDMSSKYQTKLVNNMGLLSLSFLENDKKEEDCFTINLVCSYRLNKTKDQIVRTIFNPLE